MRSLVSGNFAQRRLVFGYRHFGTAYRSYLQGLSGLRGPGTGDCLILGDGTDKFPHQTSVCILFFSVLATAHVTLINLITPNSIW
jgi:hypothetical protein